MSTMPSTPSTPLPARASLEQLKKQSKELQRAVRGAAADALALVVDHHPDAARLLATGTKFPLDAAQLVTARRYGFASWSQLRQHLPFLAEPKRPRQYLLTLAEQYHAQRDWADGADLARCQRIAGDSIDWQPLLSAEHNGVTALVVRTPAGVRFAELTPTTVVVSAPSTVIAPAGKAVLLFHTRYGTMAGVCAPEVDELWLERPTDRLARRGAIVSDGIFLVPNAFTVDESGLVLRVNNSRAGEIVPTKALPARSTATVDAPMSAVDQSSPEGRRLVEALTAADVPPVIDIDQWQAGVYVSLTAEDKRQLGRYGSLLAVVKVDDPDREPLVVDLATQQEPRVAGDTIAASRGHYDFRENSSDTMALYGIVTDERVASITLTRAGKSDVSATIGNGTFVVADIRGADLATAYLTVRDAAGVKLEKLPVQRPNRYRSATNSRQTKG